MAARRQATLATTRGDGGTTLRAERQWQWQQQHHFGERLALLFSEGILPLQLRQASEPARTGGWPEALPAPLGQLVFLTEPRWTPATP